MLKREIYLEKIKPFYDADLIKVIIGMRRSGKSVILNQIRNEILERGVSKNNIIYINFELLDFADIKNEIDLFKFVKEKIDTNEKYYLFFDEIQVVKNYEKALNSFKAGLNCSIFVTGSNASLLSGELASLIAGRYVEFRIMPFTYLEFINLKKLKNEKVDENTFLEFLKWGGMPQLLSLQTDTEKRAYLNDLYNSIVLKDILQRSNIKDINLLNRLIEYLFSSTAQTFSASSISKYLINEKINLGVQTVYNYLEYILASFVINKVQRFNIKGKKILSTLEKYFVSDLGLRRIKLKSANYDVGASLETIVYNDLIAKSFEVFVGKTDKGEIDFIAYKNDKKYYFQVAYLLANEETIKREFSAYDRVKDNYPKYVLSMDKFDFSRNGIKHLNIVDFLLMNSFK